MTDQNFELAEIYDTTDAAVYRVDDMAATVFGHRAVLVLRPWTWNRTTEGDVVEAPEAMRVGIGKLLEASPEWQAELELGDLVLWSSRRVRRDEPRAPWNDEDTSAFVVQRRDIDAQWVGPRVFNRRMIREAAQAFIEDWEGAGGMNERVKLVVGMLQNGPVLEMSLNDIRAFVMGLSESSEPGDERMPTALPPRLRCQCQWEAGDSPCPVHGMDEESDSIESTLRASTTPLPFVEKGMVLKSPFRDEWIVKSVGVDIVDRSIVLLENDEGYVIERPIAQVRRWALAKDFCKG